MKRISEKCQTIRKTSLKATVLPGGGSNSAQNASIVDDNLKQSHKRKSEPTL